jgi:hypothetical protein
MLVELGSSGDDFRMARLAEPRAEVSKRNLYPSTPASGREAARSAGTRNKRESVSLVHYEIRHYNGGTVAVALRSSLHSHPTV